MENSRTQIGAFHHTIFLASVLRLALFLFSSPIFSVSFFFSQPLPRQPAGYDPYDDQDPDGNDNSSGKIE